MKEPDCFDGIQAQKLRIFIQSCQLVFHKDPENFFSNMYKALYYTSFLTDRAGKRIEQYLSNAPNVDQSYLLTNWKLFETQSLTWFGDPNEVRIAELELKNLRMKGSHNASLYISDFRIFMSRVEVWGEKPHLHVYERALESRLLDQFASHPGKHLSLQTLLETTLELDNRYHERHKEKSSNEEKDPPVTGSNVFTPPQYSSSKKPHHKKNKNGKNFQVSKDKSHDSLLNKENKCIVSDKKRRIKEGS
ncbi:hypothetical protein O181_022010 [Austropuccinia psidii MF-1]|uniref:Retrotransposon gag domain-containing protein n=1 Tax=Austropuccinia psidii MF-1 TaxID=1389203 RepID=A0A9Q3CGM8_9BASI|nr:hypothetical protein [Austropuccinia psidii MF-1]